MRQKLYGIGAHNNNSAVFAHITPSFLVNRIKSMGTPAKLSLAGFISLPFALGSWQLLQAYPAGNLDFGATDIHNSSAGPEQNQVQQTPNLPNPTPITSSTQTESSSSSSANGASSQTTVTVDGQSVTSSTNSSKPSESINKTINTQNGTTNISIQSNNSSSGNNTFSSQDVEVHSFSGGGSSSTNINNQFEFGGGQ